MVNDASIGGIGGLLHLSRGAPYLYSYLYDGRGNVTALLDSSSNVVQTYQYDTFGIPKGSSGSVTQPIRFSTKPYDEQTGLSYYGYRFYVPAVGRWLTRDPIGEAGGVNLYGFVGNNPVNYIDPTGNFIFIPALMAGANYTGAMMLADASIAYLLGQYLYKESKKTKCKKPRKDLPARGEPNSTEVKDQGEGRGQIREYGPDGEAVRDFDFGHDHGSGDPHAHDWDWSKEPPRQDHRPIEPGE